MSDQINPTIPTEYLPDNWRDDVAKKFNLQPDTVGRVANGRRKNTAVFDHLLELAEKGKAAEDMRLERLEKLKPQNV